MKQYETWFRFKKKIRFNKKDGNIPPVERRLCTLPILSIFSSLTLLENRIKTHEFPKQGKVA